MRYKLHYAKGKDPATAWVIQEVPEGDAPARTFYAAAVDISGFAQLMPMDINATPQGWLEAEGELFIHDTLAWITAIETNDKEK